MADAFYHPPVLQKHVTQHPLSINWNDYPFMLESNDGFRVFTSELPKGIQGPADVDNYIFVGPRGSKVVTVNPEFKFSGGNFGYTRGKDAIGSHLDGTTLNRR